MATELNEERSFSSLEEVTRLLTGAEGKSFREIDETGRGLSSGNKGSLGNIIEESVLHYPVNSDKEADILVGDTRYELKVTPLHHVGKGAKKKTTAKERLVLDIINYLNLPDEEFETSQFWEKSKNIIVVYYYDDREDKKRQSRLDCKIFKSIVLHYDADDLATIRKDWQLIHDKVAEGHADQLSESDTDYLAACTKGATAKKSMRKAPALDDCAEEYILAKQRAFSYKASYMNSIIERALVEKLPQYRLPMEEGQTLAQFVASMMGRFEGRSVAEIAHELGLDVGRAKQSKAQLALRMLGTKSSRVNQIEQFQKANVTKLKTIVFYPDGLPKEHMSFRQITEDEWSDLSNPRSSWENSFLYEFFEENKFLFVPFDSPVPYKSHRPNNDILRHSFLWNMPESDIQQYVKPVWEKLHELMMSGQSVHYGRGTNLLPGASFNNVCHIRPKGRNSSDRITLPNGETIPKQTFWLDRSYIAAVVNNAGCQK